MLDLARSVATRAGEILMQRYGRLRRSEVERRGQRDVVTAADLQAEALIRRELSAATPDIPILGEEQGGGPDDRGGPCWIVDPLDGTVNFTQGIPIFAVSIGLVRDGAPELGVVHLPAMDETFWGSPGSGAYLDGRPLSVSVTPQLEDAIVATGFAYRRNEMADGNIKSVVNMIERARGIRRMGAAAVDLAYVAAGRLDGFFELHLSPWDVAGGAALIRAAGGVVSDYAGGENWLFGGNIVAAGRLLHTPLRQALTPFQAGPSSDR